MRQLISPIQPNATTDAKSAGVTQKLGGTANMFTTIVHSFSSLSFAVPGITSLALREQHQHQQRSET